MNQILMLQSRSVHESNEAEHDYQLARSLARAGHAVTVLLVQNGVFALRGSGPQKEAQALHDAGVSVLADEFSLQERGIETVPQFVTPSSLQPAVDAMAAGNKVLWL